MNLPANTADAGQILIRETINNNKNTTDLRENQVEGEYTGFFVVAKYIVRYHVSQCFVYAKL